MKGFIDHIDQSTEENTDFRPSRLPRSTAPLPDMLTRRALVDAERRLSVKRAVSLASAEIGDEVEGAVALVGGERQLHDKIMSVLNQRVAHEVEFGRLAVALAESRLCSRVCRRCASRRGSRARRWV